MYKFLMSAALMAGITLSGIAEDADAPVVNSHVKRFSAEVNLMSSYLHDEDAYGKHETNDIFDDETIGYDINVGYQVNEHYRVSIGHNQIGYDGKTASTTFAGFLPLEVDLTDLNASATYIGGELEFAKVNRVSFFAGAQLGMSKIDAISASYTNTGFLPSTFSVEQGVYKSTSDIYYGLGVGIKVDLKDDWYFKAKYMFRDYGEVETTRAGSVQGFEDFQMQTSSVDLGFGVAF